MIRRRNPQGPDLDVWADRLATVRTARELRALGLSPWVAHVARRLLWDARLVWAWPDDETEALMDRFQGAVLARVRAYDMIDAIDAKARDAHGSVIRSLLISGRHPGLIRRERSLVREVQHARNRRPVASLHLSWLKVPGVWLAPDLMMQASWADEERYDPVQNPDQGLTAPWVLDARRLMQDFRMANVGLPLRMAHGSCGQCVQQLRTTFTGLAQTMGLPDDALGLGGVRVTLNTPVVLDHGAQYSMLSHTIMLSASGRFRASLAHEWFHALDHFLGHRGQRCRTMTLMSERLFHRDRLRRFRWFSFAMHGRIQMVEAFDVAFQALQHRSHVTASVPILGWTQVLNRITEGEAWWGQAPEASRTNVTRVWAMLWPTVCYSRSSIERLAAARALALVLFPVRQLGGGGDLSVRTLCLIILEACGHVEDARMAQDPPRGFLALGRQVDEALFRSYLNAPREVFARCFETWMYTVWRGRVAPPLLVNGSFDLPVHTFYPRGEEAVEVASIMARLFDAVRPVLLDMVQDLGQGAMDASQAFSRPGLTAGSSRVAH